MDEQLSREKQVPGEVVEIYRQPERREVVEIYSRPLPACLVPPVAPRQPDRKKRKKGLWVFLALFLVLALLAAGAWLWQLLHQRSDPWDHFDYYYEVPEDDYSREISIPTFHAEEGVTLELEAGHGPELTAQEIYQQVNPSVVTVSVTLGEDSASVGTGVIFTENGYILTNYHVLEGGSDCKVVLSTDREVPAMYVAGDAENDLAILKADLEGVPAARFGDSDQMTVGDKVYAIGNPLGWELRGTLTDGIVSAINRDVQVDDRTMTLIQTNAALNSGNSGGPLINAYGQVVGINTIKMSSAYSSIEGLGFAIPTSTIQRLVEELLAYGEVHPSQGPELGVTVSRFGTQMADGVWGVEVISVSPGSAAEKAGVQAGDYIISAGGINIASSQDVLTARKQYQVGDEMPMTLWRDGRRVEVTLVLQASSKTK